MELKIIIIGKQYFGNNFQCKMTTSQGEDLVHLTQDYWNRRWNVNDTPWNKAYVNPLLTKYIRLLDGGEKDLKIFVPLCGKTIEMKWLFDLGHRVVGVDGFQTALENFFKDHSMDYTVETKNGIPAFTDRSGRITLYCCNIFDFQKTGEGSFDAVWDRASFGAINPEERARYVDLVTALKAPNASHLLELFQYDDRLFKESPLSIPVSKVFEYWGDGYDVKLLDSHEAPEVLTYLGIKFTRNFFSLTLK